MSILKISQNQSKAGGGYMIYTVRYYLTVKMNDLIDAATRINLGNIMLSERNHVCKMSRTGKLVQTQSRFMVP